MTKDDRATAVFDDLAAEYEQLDAVLAGLEPDMWARPSAADGWTIADVVLHLAQTEEAVIASVAGDLPGRAARAAVPVDELVEGLVAGERGAPGAEVFERWRSAGRSALEALRACSPGDRLQWVVTAFSPRTLATTRIAEHWAHALDITEPLGLDYPDTARLRHIAWLAHRTLPYAFSVAGEQGGPVRCELTGPGGELWRFGDADTPSVISGPAAEFCRVGARRLPAERASLTAQGPYAAAALRVLRNYAA
ncbi:TIGR03084 family metal-binding protein [Sphaerisporangium flaviroseum]|uniref:TIGR03084 family metal-binding protein n=1 Tax=Sphaerisporangium flaviroseum TaxID=509199 RepID=A0ABP7IJU3_9ACTN